MLFWDKAIEFRIGERREKNGNQRASVRNTTEGWKGDALPGMEFGTLTVVSNIHANKYNIDILEQQLW